MKRKSLKKKAAIIITALLLFTGAALILHLPGEDVLAETAPGESVVLQNEDGEQLLIKVEEEITAEERALRNEASIAGAVDLGEDAVPLAGFSELGAGDFGVDEIHIGWMILLFAAALGYAAYFTRYQSRLFALRREVAEAEHELFRKDRQ